jgi:hypothetical protein
MDCRPRTRIPLAPADVPKTSSAEHASSALCNNKEDAKGPMAAAEERAPVKARRANHGRPCSPR